MRKLFLLFLVTHAGLVSSQIGLTINDQRATPGYTLFHPNSATSTFLIDNAGNLVFEWEGTHLPGVRVHLLENGQLLRSGKIPLHFNMGGVGGYLELVEPDGTVSWSYEFLTETEQSHHDFAVLPNGNILLLLLVEMTEEEAIAAGRDPESLDGSLWSEKIIEFTPVGTDQIEVVWEWNLWDHLVQDFDASKDNYGMVAEHPEKLNLNYYNENLNLIDWIHLNSIDYNPELDQIVVGSPFIHEVWIIDHSTTTEEAKTGVGGNSGMGGDFLYRWGNPIAYDHGVADDQRLFGQHNPHWQYKNGGYQLLLFNNGNGRSEEYSSIDLIDLPFDPVSKTYSMDESGRFLPEQESSIYQSEIKTEFFSRIVSGVQELENGNYFICEGFSGRFFEVNPEGEILWEFVNPHNDSGLQCSKEVDEVMGNITFRAQKIPLDYPGLPDNLVSRGLLERRGCPLALEEATDILVYPNPFNDQLTIRGALQKVEVISLQGKTLFSASQFDGAIDTKDWLPGMYLLKVQLADGSTQNTRIVKRS